MALPWTTFPSAQESSWFHPTSQKTHIKFLVESRWIIFTREKRPRSLIPGRSSLSREPTTRFTFGKEEIFPRETSSLTCRRPKIMSRISRTTRRQVRIFRSFIKAQRTTTSGPYSSEKTKSQRTTSFTETLPNGTSS